MNRILISLLFSACVTVSVAAPQVKKGNVLDLKNSITDSEIVYPESFETDTQKLLEGWYLKNYTASDRRYATESDPNVSDAVIRKRLSELPTVIDMPFNQIVRSYIDRYTRNGRAQVTALLGLSTYYMPIFEQALEEQKLPLELKYLPVIESGLDPNATSRHGAAGLWQFMIGPATGIGLEVSSLVDERRDPYASSKAAAKFLKDLYSTYGDWSLAIAAYNCGPGTVNKALRRAGGDPGSHDFWSIYYYLPQETRGYVPMFIAANYVMTHYADHKISPVLPTKPLVTDTIGVSQRIHLNQISAVLDIPVDELRILNPQFRADIIPGTPERVYTLILPSQQVHAYIMSEKDILAYDSEKYARKVNAEPGGNPSEEVEEEQFNPADLTPASESLTASAEPIETMRPRQVIKPDPAVQENTPDSKVIRGKLHTVTHTVAQGETLASIATMYDTDVASIRRDNSLRRNAVRTGQKLRIQTTVSGTAKTQSGSTATDTPAKSTSATAPQKNAASKVADKGVANNKVADKKTGSKKAEVKQASTHEVKSGENLSTIAKKNGTTVEELRKANPNLKGDMIRPGDKVNLPKGKASTGKGKSTSSTGKKGIKSGKKGKGKKKK